MKLALGTAQFGGPYGAFNENGQVRHVEVAQMLGRAAELAIDTLDTARAYGSAELVLGAAGAARRFRIVTKCPPLARAPDAGAALDAAFEASCAALGTDRLYGFLLHDARDLSGEQGEAIWCRLAALRAMGRVERIGVSAYGIEEAQALCRRFPLTLVQVPANVLQPWYESAELPDGVEVHVRSAFLQGFLLREPDALPERFRPWRGTLEAFRAQAAARGLSPVQAALAPLMHSKAIDRVVVGTDGLAQLDAIVEAVSALPSAGNLRFGPFPDATPALTDPRQW